MLLVRAASGSNPARRGKLGGGGGIRFFQWHPSLCRAALKRSLEKINRWVWGGALLIRLSLGDLLLLVNDLLQVAKRTNTPLISLTNSVVGRIMFFLGRGFESHIHHNKLFQTFSHLFDSWHVELEKYSPCEVSPGNETAWILTRPPVS